MSDIMHKPWHEEVYVDGTGQVVAVHRQVDCRGDHCVIHKPSFHKMNGWPTLWRNDIYLMERLCCHGIGHPDPDHLAFTKTEHPHGCDGCCKGAYNG